MIFVREASAAVALVTLTLLLHCAGMAALISWGRTSLAPNVRGLGPIRSAMLMVRFITAFIILHIFEILLWAAFYRWLCFPVWESAFYFSTSSYATVGYGDIVLPQMWRTLGPVESIIGVLMCGLSASFLFAIVTRLVERETRVSDTPITDTHHASPGTRIRQSVSRCRARTFEIRREGLSAKQRGSDSRLPLPHTKAAGPPARQDTLSRYSLGQDSHQGKERHPFQILGTLLS